MPRKVRSPETTMPRPPSELVQELAEELKSGRESGQPIIDEDHFKTGAIRVVVLWDRWHDLDSESRSDAILEAYRMVEGEDFAGRIALVNGLTIPEAIASGLLPVKVIAAIRADDPVTPEQCQEAMIAEGASTLDSLFPELRFATEAEAKAGLKRLASRLPGSEPAWVIIHEPKNRFAQTHWDFSE